MERPNVLLNPGPVNLTERVRRALAGEDVCHREPEFAALTLDVAARLVALYPGAAESYRAILVGGSGTSAVEALLASLIPRDGKALVVANGVYGERMGAMVAAHGKPVELARAGWLEPMDLGAVERRLDADPSITHVAAVHNETTSGRLNDVGALARLCRDRGRELLLDAVSSFGAEELDFAAWSPAGVAATANKCLHGAPGVSFALVRADLLRAGESAAPSVYLDLFGYRAQVEAGFSPFTLPTHACRALQEALREHDELGGWQARRRRYRELSARIRDGLAALGVQTVLEREAYSSMISSFHLPAGRSYEDLHDGCKRAGFVIYAGQGDLAREVFRIANMGDIADGDMDRFLSAFEALQG